MIDDLKDGGMGCTLEGCDFFLIVGMSVRGKQFEDEGLGVMGETINAG